MTKEREKTELEDNVRYIRETLEKIERTAGSEEVSKVGAELKSLTERIKSRYGGIVLGAQHRKGLCRELRRTIKEMSRNKVFNQTDLSYLILGEEAKDKSIRTLMKNLWRDERESLDIVRLELSIGGHSVTHYMKPVCAQTTATQRTSEAVVDNLPVRYVKQFGRATIENCVEEILSSIKEEGYIPYLFTPKNKISLKPILDRLVNSFELDLGGFLRTDQPAVIYDSARIREKNRMGTA